MRQRLIVPVGSCHTYKFIVRASPCAPLHDLPIKWTDLTPVWVEQWPMSLQKLRAVEALIEEQLTLGHIRPSTSAWNTPIFVVKTKSGKWRLLQDRRKVNERMQVMGPLQCGMPNPNLIPQDYDL